MKKRILSLVLALVMLVSTLPLPALAAEPEGRVNLGLHATALACENECPSLQEEPLYAFDGNKTGTKWCMYGKGWMCFTLEHYSLLQEMRVYHAGSSSGESRPNNTVSFALQVLDPSRMTDEAFFSAANQAPLMDDDTLWTTVASVQNNTLAITETDVSMTAAHRVYRFDVTDAGADNTTRIYEIELFGSDTTVEPANVARSATVLGTQFNSPQLNESPYSALDGDRYYSKWCMMNSGWLCLALDQPAQLSHMRLYHAGFGLNETVKNNTTAYALEVLNESRITEEDFLNTDNKFSLMEDNANWIAVATVRGNSADVTTTALSMAERRQVFRLKVIDAGADNTTRVYEIEFYEAAPAASLRVKSGSATADKTTVHSALPGVPVTITAADASGKVFDHWEVIRGDVVLKDASSPTITFTMPDGDVYLEAVCGDELISSVSPTGLNMPALGESPNYALSVPEGAPYHLASREELAEYSFTNINDNHNGMWWMNKGEDTNLTPESTFTNPAQGAYAAMIVLIPNQGYRFADTVRAKINDNASLVRVCSVFNGSVVLRTIGLTAVQMSFTSYDLTVVDGTASIDGKTVTSALADDVVTLTADPAPAGQLFDHWEVLRGQPTLADATKATTTFAMPAEAVKVKAVYKDKELQAIRSISISDVALPILGEHPDYDVTIPQDAPYHLATEQELRAAGLNRTDAAHNGIWWRTDHGDTFLTPESTFTDDSPLAYSMTVLLVPNEGYHFQGDFTVTVNGEVFSKAGGPVYNKILALWAGDFTAVHPAGTTFGITVDNGTASADGHPVTSASPGSRLELTADPPRPGYVFDRWEIVSGDFSLYNSHRASTLFIMPGEAVHVRAVYAEIIDQVSISGMEFPVLGGHPSFDVTIPKDAHYHLATHRDLEAAAGSDPEILTNYNGAWWRLEEDDSTLTPDDTFDSAKPGAYYMQIVLVPNEGYRFDKSMAATLNGGSGLIADMYPVGRTLTIESISLTARKDLPDTKPAAPADFNVTVRFDGKPYLTWDAVEGADGYEIQRADGKGDFQEFYTARGTSLRHGSAKPGETYTYRIRTVIDGKKSDWVESRTVRSVLARPTVTVSARADGKPVLTWDKVDGAQQYLVYYCTNDEGGFDELTFTKGTKLNHTSAKPGNTYTYIVNAQTEPGQADSAWSQEVSFTVEEPSLTAPTLTATNKRTTGKPYLKWDKIDGAEEYEVYRATSKDGKYSRLWHGTGTALTNGSAKAGTTYYYKVRAVAADSTKGPFSTITTRTCDLPCPDVKLTTRSDGKPVLTWQKIDGAVKYEVYRRVDGGEFSRLTTVKGTKLTNTSAKSGHTYTYKVKAIASRSAANSNYSYTDTIQMK